MKNKDVKNLEERITELEDRVTRMADIVLLLIDINKDIHRLYEYMGTISDAVSFLLATNVKKID